MSYDPKNAIRPKSFDGGGGLLSQGELAQGNENATQNGVNVSLLDSSGNPLSPSNPIIIAGSQVWISAEMVLGTGHTYANGLVAGPDVGADTTIAGAGRVTGGAGIILKARLMTNNVLMIGSLAAFRVHLYDDAAGIVTPINNFAANTMLYANALHRIGSIDFQQFITGGTGSDSAVSYGIFQSGNAACMPFKCNAGATSLCYRVETIAAPTLVTGQKFMLLLNLIQN